MTVSGRERLLLLEGDVLTGEDLERAGEEVQDTVGNWGSWESWGSTASFFITSIVTSTRVRGLVSLVSLFSGMFNTVGYSVGQSIGQSIGRSVSQSVSKPVS